MRLPDRWAADGPTLDRPEKNKPVQTVVERFIQLDACRYVDEIVVYATEADLREILLAYPIDVRILGEEYKDKKFTGHDIPMEFYFNSRRHSFSTSELRQRVLAAEKPKIGVVKSFPMPGEDGSPWADEREHP